MAAVRKRNESSVIDQIGDDLLSWVSTILRLKLYILFQTFSYIEYIFKMTDGRKKTAKKLKFPHFKFL